MESTNSFQRIQPKQTNKQHGLRRMFLLNESAFQNVKHEIDNEKYLSSMDRDLKKILMNNKLPDYKKWLQYRELLAKYLNFRDFLKETQLHEDKSSSEEILKLMKRLSEVEKKITMNQSTQMTPSTIEVVETDIADAGKNTPNEPTDLNESFLQVKSHTHKRKSTTPIQDTNTPQSLTRRKLDFGENENQAGPSFVPLNNTILGDVSMQTAPAGEEQIYGDDFEHNNSNFMDISLPPSEVPHLHENLDDSGELLRLFDDQDLLGRNTIRQRLDSAAPSVQKSFKNDHGEYFSRTFVVHFADDEGNDESISLNGLDIKITDEKALKYKTKTRWERIKNIKEDSWSTIRNFLLEFHKLIDEAIESYNKQLGHYIGAKPYSIRENKENNTAVIRYKGIAAVTIPMELVDAATELMDTADMDEKQFKEEMKKLKRMQYRNETRSGLNVMEVDSSMPSSAAMALARLSSTPATGKKKRSAAHLKLEETTVNTQPDKIPRNTQSRSQQGSGFVWITI